MKSILLIPLLLLAACTPQPTPKSSLDKVNSEFVGRDSGLFFASYGAPSGTKILKDGTKVYRWLSIEPESDASEGGFVDYPGAGGHYSIPEGNSNGEMFTGYCEVRIRTNVDEIIKSITLVNDSIGKFSGSRCAEIFSQSAN